MGPALLSLLDKIGGWPLITPQWTEFSSSHEEYVADIYKEYGLQILWFNLEKYVNRLLEGIGPVNPDMMICIFDVEYYKKIHTLFKDKRVFANCAASYVAYYFHNLPFTDMDANVPPSVLKQFGVEVNVSQVVLPAPTSSLNYT
uniref:Glucuronosyltransferase n=1 Tax=Panagrellus redivivus TaxID=6233 RepID=A0A7E4VSZ5_PANRE